MCRNQSSRYLTTSGEGRQAEDEVPGDHGDREEVADLLEHAVDAEQRDVAAPHDAQVDGVEGRHGEDAGEQLGAVVGGRSSPDLRSMCRHAGDAAGAEAAPTPAAVASERRVAADDERAGDGGAQRQAAVDGEVGEVEHAEGEEHAEDHEAVEQALLERAGE